MGPFYKTNAASTASATRRIGNLAVFAAKNVPGESLAARNGANSNSFNLFENANMHLGRKPDSTGK